MPPWRTAAHGQCRRVCHCWGHALTQGTTTLPGPPCKDTCPIPRGHKSPMQYGPGHGRTPVTAPLGPVSCSTGSLIVPVSSVRPLHGAQRHHTRARARSPACDPLGATGSKHGSGGEHPRVCTDPHPCAHTWWPLHTHCTCMKLTHGHVHVRHLSASMGHPRLPPSHPQRHRTYSLTVTALPLNTQAHVCAQIGTGTCSHLRILVHAGIHIQPRCPDLPGMSPCTHVPTAPAHLCRCCPGA